MKRTGFVIGLVVVLLVVTGAGRAAGPGRTHAVTLDDYFAFAVISEVATSPDGELVAYAEGRWQASTNDRQSDLWVVTTKTGDVSRLTFDRAADRGLKWSPDGKFIYFFGD